MTHAARGGRAPRMADVGRVAGVSAQTVSRYFTGSGYVGEQTRLRIESAIDELGYTFNQAARDLRVKSTRTVGVLSLGAPVYGAWAVMSGLNQASYGADFSLVTSVVERGLSSAHREAGDLQQALERLLAARVDGIVVSSAYVGIEELLDGVWEKVPVVILAGGDWAHADSAHIDSYEAGVLATEHLIGLGHTQILHLGGPLDLEAGHERERGYSDAMERAGLVPVPVARGDWSADSGAARCEEVDPSDFTAVFSGNDHMALGFMSEMRRRGLTVPDDYSIVGVDDMPDARYFAPALTTVFMDLVGLGRLGYEMITESITTGKRLGIRTIRPELVVRESTRPVKPASR